MQELIRRSASNERLAQAAIHNQEMKLAEIKADHQAEVSKLMQDCASAKARAIKQEAEHATEVSPARIAQNSADPLDSFKHAKKRLRHQKPTRTKPRPLSKNSSRSCKAKMNSFERILNKQTPPISHCHLAYIPSLKIFTLHLLLCAALTLAPAQDPACHEHPVASFLLTKRDGGANHMYSITRFYAHVMPSLYLDS